MEFSDALLFPTPLDKEGKARARGVLNSRLAGNLDRLLGLLQRPESLSRVGDRAQEMRSLFAEVLELSTSAPDSFSEFLGHWSTAFLLGQLLGTEPLDARLVDQLLGNVTALLICLRLEGAIPASAARFITPQTFYCLARGVRLQVRVPSTSAGRVVWEFSDSRVSLWLEGAPVPFAQVPLPLRGEGSFIAATPLPISRRWGVPVVEDCELLGVLGSHVSQAPVDAAARHGWHPMPLVESLDAAHATLAELWPEVLDWGEVLLPAYVDMGGASNRWVRGSSSYGAGSPIFLSPVEQAFKHAEDIVHELQHVRMSLLFDTSGFGSWEDLSLRFFSPYRSAPRPLNGLHLGIHSFLAVNRLRLLAGRKAPLESTLRNQLLATHRRNLWAFRTVLEFEQIAPHGRPLMAAMARELVVQHGEIEPMVDAGVSERIDDEFRTRAAAVQARAPVLNTSRPYMAWEQIIEIATRYAGAEEFA